MKKRKVEKVVLRPDNTQSAVGIFDCRAVIKIKLYPHSNNNNGNTVICNYEQL